MRLFIAPFQTNYKDRGAEFPCVLCGRNITQPSRFSIAHGEDTSFIVDHASAPVEAVGYYDVGRECARKLPKEFLFVTP